MKLITAIARTDSLDSIAKSLVDKGIRGMTITEVKGIGEQMQLLNPYTIHSRVEIIIPEEKANEVTNIILSHAHTGEAGDGLVAVSPVERLLKIRTREQV